MILFQMQFLIKLKISSFYDDEALGRGVYERLKLAMEMSLSIAMEMSLSKVDLQRNIQIHVSMNDPFQFLIYLF